MSCFYLKAKQTDWGPCLNTLRVFEMPNGNSDILKFLAQNYLQNLDQLAHSRDPITNT
jgi:hypothetical protein